MRDAVGRRVRTGRRAARSWPSSSSSSSSPAGSASAGRSWRRWPPARWASCCSARQGTQGARRPPRAGPDPPARPGRELGDAGLVAAGGLLMVLPGFLGDLVGLLCLLPVTRGLSAALLTRAGARRLPDRHARAGARAQRPPGTAAPVRRTGGRRPSAATVLVIEGEVARTPLAAHGSRGRRRDGDASSGGPDAERPRWRSTGAVRCVRAGLSWRGCAVRGAPRGARPGPLRGPRRNDARAACPSGCAGA